jgi:hypothetical protein
MRYVNGFLCVLLTLFTVAQYNDPDAILWILIYGIPAVWAGIAAFRPAVFARSRPLQVALAATIVLAALGSIYMWPTEISTWWDNEEVREGLGLITVTVSMLIVAYGVWRQPRPRTARLAA